MQWSEIFSFNKKCNHDKVPLDVEIGYCPDCGELIKNRWYIVRCDCCGVKGQASAIDGQVVSAQPFCRNCGGTSFIVEEIEKLDCININYAIVVKEVIKNEVREYTQSWFDTMQTINYKPKLLK